MIERIQVLNGAIRILFASTFVLALLFVVSCDNGDDEPEPELYDLSGFYTFNEAILQTAIEIPGIPFPIAKGTDITDQMAGGLLAEAPCDNPENGAVELRENKELYFACIGESSELQAGTWNINSDTTELTLSLSVPQALQLKISNLEINETTDIIGGSISNFPLNKELIGGFIPELQRDAILAGIDDNFVLLITVDIKFQKEE